MRSTRPIVAWLFTVYAFIFAIVLVGGITRLTGSGLSMVEWRPIAGAVPPGDDAEWERVFAQYQRSPQFQQVNSWMTVDDFKRIFFWEYLHRLLGRAVGVVFLLPWALFLIQGRLKGPLAWKTGLALVLGGLQGVLGWWMVKSGLVDVPAVSHYRLAAHLVLALFTAHWVLWIALDLLPGSGLLPSNRDRALAWGLVALVSVQIVYGALMAGTRAGLHFPTFPDMNGELVPAGMGAFGPWWRDAVDNPATIHFIHRMLAFALVFAAAAWWWRQRLRGRGARRVAAAIGALVVLQVVLGAITVVFHVPITAAVAHQGLGVLVLSAAVVAAHRAWAGRPTVG